MEDYMTVNEVAEFAKIPFYLINYHERLKRLPMPSKMGGYRVYTQAQAQHIKEYFKEWTARPRQCQKEKVTP